MNWDEVMVILGFFAMIAFIYYVNSAKKTIMRKDVKNVPFKIFRRWKQ